MRAFMHLNLLVSVSTREFI